MHSSRAVILDYLISIFIQTPFDTVSSIEPFVGRKRNEDSTTYLYMRQVRVPEDKFTFMMDKKRNKKKLNQLLAYTLLLIDKVSMVKCMGKMGEVIVNKIQTSLPKLGLREEEIKRDTVIIKEDDINRGFSGKKKLYQHHGFKNEKDIPNEYEISSRFNREKGKMQRIYIV